MIKAEILQALSNQKRIIEEDFLRKVEQGECTNEYARQYGNNMMRIEMAYLMIQQHIWREGVEQI